VKNLPPKGEKDLTPEGEKIEHFSPAIRVNRRCKKDRRGKNPKIAYLCGL
jgi:hypothetical protein